MERELRMVIVADTNTPEAREVLAQLDKFILSLRCVLGKPMSLKTLVTINSSIIKTLICQYFKYLADGGFLCIIIK